MKEKQTIQKVAKATGLSTATISRAMNPQTQGKVAPKTLERVQKAVRKLGYFPSLATRVIGSRAPTERSLFAKADSKYRRFARC